MARLVIENDVGGIAKPSVDKVEATDPLPTPRVTLAHFLQLMYLKEKQKTSKIEIRKKSVMVLKGLQQQTLLRFRKLCLYVLPHRDADEV